MSSNAKSLSGKPVSLVWLRRDLRLFDHGAFAAAAQPGLPAQAVFILDTDVLARFKQKHDRRLSFIADALCRLHGQLAERGGGLLVFHGKAETLIPRIAKALNAEHVYAAEDFEPATRQRDKAVAEALGKRVEFKLIPDHLLQPPNAVLKADGAPFKVFTPYSQAWHQSARARGDFAAERSLKGLACAEYETMFTACEAHGMHPFNPADEAEAMLAHAGYVYVESGWPVDTARALLHAFAEKRMGDYATRRDFMGKEEGTSRLSPYLRFGLISIRECARLALEQEARGSRGASVWLKELIWRDFYAMILFHFPETEQKEMQAQYRGLPWSYDKEHLRRFAEGMTGYPVVDAAMRELLETGYMHNRARMIVASFMTKHLLLDWRLGEEHFAQHLMDYELSSNVGGWQWAASTGTDAQPYFRVFNPVLQSRKFDPEGAYIRRYVPELETLSAKDIHEPWKLSPRPKHYPAPIVEHAQARARAIATFRKASAA